MCKLTHIIIHGSKDKKCSSVQVPHHIHCDAQCGNSSLSKRPQLRVPQESRQDLHQPVSPQRNSLPPQRLQPLALHILIHTCQSGQGP